MTAKLLDKEELALRWGEIEPQIARAVAHGLGESSTHDLFLECLDGIAQCWAHEDGFCITRIIRFSQYNQLQIVACGGKNWFEVGPAFLEVMEQFARDIGCRNVSIWGRKGWKRVLKDYHEPYTVLIKEL